jgi:peptidoglycan-associated lipoprotein
MPRFALSRLTVFLAAVLCLAACTRGQSNYGLNASQFDGAGQGGENGPIVPGTVREFSARVGDTIYFSTDSTELGPEARQTLIGQAQWLSRYPQYRILIEGHADERGTREYNIGLGANRAANAKDFLVSRGVDPARIRTLSFGKERPVAVCPDISCWSQNRRAVTVLAQEGATAGY